MIFIFLLWFFCQWLTPLLRVNGIKLSACSFNILMIPQFKKSLDFRIVPCLPRGNNECVPTARTLASILFWSGYSGIQGVNPSVKVCINATIAFSSVSVRPRFPIKLLSRFVVVSGAGQHVMPNPGSVLLEHTPRTSLVL